MQRRPAPAQQGQPGNKLGFIFFLAVLFWAPIPLASARVWAAAALAMVLAALLLGTALSDFMRGHAHLERIQKASVPLLALAAFALLLLVQTVGVGSGPLSADPHASLVALLFTLAYTCAFLLVLLLVTTPERVRALAMLIVAAGVAQSLFGILMYSAKVKYSIFFFEVNHASHVTGTFGYRNSMANYLLMSFSIGLGLVVGQMISREQSVTAFSWKEFARDAVGFLLSPAMRLRLMLIVIVMALVLTRSRGGNASFMVALALVALPFLWQAGRMRKIVLWLVASIVVIDIAIVGKFVGVDRVVERLNQTALQSAPGPQSGQSVQSAAAFGEESLEDRSGPALQALSMAADNPVLGVGAGAFYTVFPRYAAPEHRGQYDHAHNDYAQIAAETGLLGFGLLALVLGACLLRAFSVLRRPLRSADRGLALGVLMAAVAVICQGFVDFHFQIPANTVTVIVIIALPWALRKNSSQRQVVEQG